jgi:hypothetical protein
MRCQRLQIGGAAEWPPSGQPLVQHDAELGDQIGPAVELADVRTR